MLPVHEAAIRRVAAVFRNDRIGYATDFLGQIVTPQQQAISHALDTHGRVLVPSAHKVGKTHFGSAIVQHHHDSYDPGIAICTGPTMGSLKKQLFREIRHTRPFGLGLMPQAPEIQHTPKHFVLGLVSKKGGSFQGKHEEHALFLFDEATDIDQIFWDRTEGMFSEGHKWVCFYNTYDPTTPPYLAEQSGEWAVVRLSALDHPNIAAELRGSPPPIPAAIRLSRVVKRIKKECEYTGTTKPVDDGTCFLWPSESARLSGPPPPNAGAIPWGWYKPLTIEFEVQILGLWPSSAFDAVWNDTDWKRCLGTCEVDPDWPVQLGCDVSRGGADSTTIAVRKGIALVHLEKFSVRGVPRPSKKIADRCRSLCKEHETGGQPAKTIPVLIDDTGGYGSGVCDYPDGFNFIGINAAEKAIDQRKYPNRKAELWWTVRLAADTSCFVVGTVRVGTELVAELGADLKAARYSLDRHNRRVVEGKDAIKARLKRSPDVADAVCLSWYPVPDFGGVAH
jgi:hypothetical protein